MTVRVLLAATQREAVEAVNIDLTQLLASEVHPAGRAQSTKRKRQSTSPKNAAARPRGTATLGSTSTRSALRYLSPAKRSVSPANVEAIRAFREKRPPDFTGL